MINLLPERYKKELREERRFRLLTVLFSVFTIALLCFALMLGSIRVYMAGSLSLQESKIGVLEARFSQDSPALAEIEALNEKVSQVQRFLKRFRPVSNILEALESILPPGAYFTSFDYDSETTVIAGGKGGTAQQAKPRISVSGFAKNREALFTFRENLQKQPLFSGLSFPPSNWAQPEDIHFSLQTGINQ